MFVFLLRATVKSRTPAVRSISAGCMQGRHHSYEHSCGLRHARRSKNGERMTIIGMLREVGTARFSRLVITPLANYDIHLSIKKNQMEDYPRLQHTFIEVTGVVTVQKVQFGTNERNWYSMTVESARRVGK